MYGMWTYWYKKQRKFVFPCPPDFLSLTGMFTFTGRQKLEKNQLNGGETALERFGPPCRHLKSSLGRNWARRGSLSDRRLLHFCIAPPPSRKKERISERSRQNHWYAHYSPFLPFLSFPPPLAAAASQRDMRAYFCEWRHYWTRDQARKKNQHRISLAALCSEKKEVFFPRQKTCVTFSKPI